MSDYTSVCATDTNENQQEAIFKVYKIRWIILSLYVICCASSLMQWIQYSIIANTIVDYYNVSYITVDWSSMVYLLVYVPFVFPACYVIDTMGLRVAALIGMAGTCAGSWIKVASVSPDRFWVVILGQGVVGISQVFLLGIPSKLAAVWFGPKQVSSACSIGISGIELGLATGFLIPPMLVDKREGKDGVERGLYSMLIAVASITTLLLIIAYLFFKERPPTPPSLAQSQIRQKREYNNFLQSLKELFRNYSYISLLVSYGIVLGVVMTVSTLLNQIVLKYYPDAAADAGRIGLVKIICGTLGVIITGVILDTFYRFKETTSVIYSSCLLSLIAFTFLLDKGIAGVYFITGVLGFFMSSVYTVGYELAAEITYPMEEGTSAGVMSASAQIFGIIFIYLYSYLLDTLGDRISNLTMCGMLGVATLLVVFCIRYDLKRHKVQVDAKKAKIVKT